MKILTKDVKMLTLKTIRKGKVFFKK